MVETKRAERRRRTVRAALRRRREYDQWVNDTSFGIVVVDPVPPGRTWRFARHLWSHRCGKRRKGSPKVGYGVCHPETREAVRARVLSRRLARDLTAGRLDPDDVLPPRGFHGIVPIARP